MLQLFKVAFKGRALSFCSANIDIWAFIVVLILMVTRWLPHLQTSNLNRVLFRTHWMKLYVTWSELAETEAKKERMELGRLLCHTIFEVQGKSGERIFNR